MIATSFFADYQPARAAFLLDRAGTSPAARFLAARGIDIDLDERDPVYALRTWQRKLAPDYPVAARFEVFGNAADLAAGAGEYGLSYVSGSGRTAMNVYAAGGQYRDAEFGVSRPYRAVAVIYAMAADVDGWDTSTHADPDAPPSRDQIAKLRGEAFTALADSRWNGPAEYPLDGSWLTPAERDRCLPDAGVWSEVAPLTPGCVVVAVLPAWELSPRHDDTAGAQNGPTFLVRDQEGGAWFTGRSSTCASREVSRAGGLGALRVKQRAAHRDLGHRRRLV